MRITQITDPLSGVARTWSPDYPETPIYDQVVSELGPPGTGAGPARVVRGEVVQTIPLGVPVVTR